MGEGAQQGFNKCRLYYPDFLRRWGRRIQTEFKALLDRALLEGKVGRTACRGRGGWPEKGNMREPPGEQELGNGHLNKSHTQLTSETLTCSQQQPASYAASWLDNHSHWFPSVLI